MIKPSSRSKLFTFFNILVVAPILCFVRIVEGTVEEVRVGQEDTKGKHQFEKGLGIGDRQIRDKDQYGKDITGYYLSISENSDRRK